MTQIKYHVAGGLCEVCDVRTGTRIQSRGEKGIAPIFANPILTITVVNARLYCTHSIPLDPRGIELPRGAPPLPPPRIHCPGPDPWQFTCPGSSIIRSPTLTLIKIEKIKNRKFSKTGSKTMCLKVLDVLVSLEIIALYIKYINFI